MPPSSLRLHWPALVDLALPRLCAGCGRPGPPLCDRCLPPGPVEAHALFGGPVMAGGVYAGALRRALIAYKERNRRDLAPALSRLLAVAIGSTWPHTTVVIPMPTSGSARARRGTDPVRALARRAAELTGHRVLDVLRLTGPVRDQAGLDAAARALNLRGAMAAIRPPPAVSGPPAVLVDDIVTTGSTLREAVRALNAEGWSVAGAAVVAATPLGFEVDGR